MRTLTVTRHRPTMGEDDYGNAVPTGYTDAALEAIWVNRTSSRDIVEGRKTMFQTARGMFPAGTDLDDDDELTALGARWRIVGLIRAPRPTNPSLEWHVTVDLERAE